MPQYHGLEVFVPQNDRPHIEYFQEAATGQFNLQKCVECDLYRYPPGSLCPGLRVERAALGGRSPARARSTRTTSSRTR